MKDSVHFSNIREDRFTYTFDVESSQLVLPLRNAFCTLVTCGQFEVGFPEQDVNEGDVEFIRKVLTELGRFLLTTPDLDDVTHIELGLPA